MTSLRFSFQRECAEKYGGMILNIGANDDPGGLRSLHNVLNCDIVEEDEGKELELHHIFDCTVKPWPFRKDSADLVIFGDIVEHLYPDEAKVALLEANRVARNICVTLPKDDRVLAEGYEDQIKGVRKGKVHVYPYTEEELRELLADTGWEVTNFQVVNYEFVPVGYFIEARKCA